MRVGPRALRGRAAPVRNVALFQRLLSLLLRLPLVVQVGGEGRPSSAAFNSYCALAPYPCGGRAQRPCQALEGFPESASEREGVGRGGNAAQLLRETVLGVARPAGCSSSNSNRFCSIWNPKNLYIGIMSGLVYL